LIRTACDPFPPAAGRAAVVLAPLLLPLNRCHSPALDDDPAVDPDVDPADDRPGLIADVLPEDDPEGFTRCHPPLLLPVEPAPRTAELVDPVPPDRGAPMLLAACAIACRC
jgi:hypothetical protein